MAQHFCLSAVARTISLGQALRMVDAEVETTFAPAIWWRLLHKSGSDAARDPRRADRAPRLTVAISTVWRFLEAHNITVKKKSLHAAEQTRPDVAAARRAFIRRQPAPAPERLVLLDETGASTNMARRHGRCARGLRLLAPVPHGHWKTTTLIAGLRTTGIVAPYVLDGAVTGPVFRSYTEQILAPALQPGDILVMDNLPTHKVAGIRQAVESRGAQLLYLPPCSPDLNPIEQAFAKLKGLLRKAAERTRDGLWQAIGRIIDLVTPEECRNLFRNAGYAT